MQGEESAGGDEWDWADELWVSSPAAPGGSLGNGQQQPQLQRARQPQIMPAPELIFAEPALSQFLDMPSQVSSAIHRIEICTSLCCLRSIACLDVWKYKTFAQLHQLFGGLNTWRLPQQRFQGPWHE